MFLEYDWTFNVYRARFMGTFIEVGGLYSFESKEHARLTLLSRGLRIGRKIADRSWKIELVEENK